MKKIVKVVRYSNMGFDNKPYRSKVYYHTGVFYNYLIESYSLHQTVSLYKRDTDTMLNQNPEGCFVFMHHYDESQVSENGSLSIKSGARKNIGYLHVDEVVYARNIHADMKRHFIGEIIHETPEPSSGILYEFPKSSIYDRYNWIQMPVSVFLERSREHFELYGRVHEIISEVYLTSDQTLRLIPRHKSFVMNLLKKYEVIA